MNLVLQLSSSSSSSSSTCKTMKLVRLLAKQLPKLHHTTDNMNCTLRIFFFGNKLPALFWQVDILESWQGTEGGKGRGRKRKEGEGKGGGIPPKWVTRCYFFPMSLKSVNNLCSKQAWIILHCKHDENYSTFKCFHHRINKSLMFLFPGCFPHIGLFSSEFCQICLTAMWDLPSLRLTAMWGSPSWRLTASQFSVTFQHQGSVCRRGIKARGGKNEV